MNLKASFGKLKAVFSWGNENIASALEWRYLRDLGNSPAMKLTILTPIFGYFILFSKEIEAFISEHLTTKSDVWKIFLDFIGLNYSINAPIAWKLIFIYFGLVFISIGQIIFNTRCPREIKDFKYDADFIESRMRHTNHMNALWLSGEAKKLLSKNEKIFFPIRDHIESARAYLRKQFDTTWGKYVDIVEMREHPRVDYKTEEFIEMLRSFYELSNRTRPLSIAMIYAFYSMGILMLAAPSVATFLSVLSVL